MNVTNEGRPVAVTERPTANESLTVSVPDSADTTELERLAEVINGTFVAVVYVAEGKVRRRVFLSLTAAQRCVDRARERGQEASVVLAELRPVFVLSGGGDRGA